MALTAPHKQTIHRRRSRGQHHKRDQHYLKPYHPYLPLLLLVLVALGLNLLWSSQSKVLGATSAISSSQLLTATNVQRSTHGITGLTIDDRLDAAAQAKANDMVDRDYWSHDTPDGASPWHFVERSGYAYQIAGENLAYGFRDSNSVISGWMNSAEHRANTLSKNYTQVGFGIATSQNYLGKGPSTIVVAFYAAPQAQPGAAGLNGGTVGTFASANAPRVVSRIELLSAGRAPWSLAALILVSMSAGLIFITRHARAWHRLVVKGENFVLHHKSLDLVVLSIVLLGIIMTRSTGFIG